MNKKIFYIIYSVLFIVVLFIQIYYSETHNNFKVKETEKIISKSGIAESELSKNFTSRYFFINGGYDGIYIFDSSENKIIKNISTGYFVNKIIRKDNYLYISDKKGLKIYKINNSYDLELVNTFNTFGDSLDIDLNDKYIYVADGKNGLVVFERKDEIYLRLKEHININGMALRVLIKDNYVFLIGPKSGFLIYEIIDGTHILKGKYDKLLSPKELYTFEDKIFIIDDFLGIIEFSYSDIKAGKTEEKRIFDLSAESLICEGNNEIILNDNGIYKMEDDYFEKILSGDFKNGKFSLIDGNLFISLKERGFEIYERNTMQKIYEYNILNYVNSIKVIDEKIFTDDGKILYKIDKDYNIEQEVFSGGIYKKYENGYIIESDGKIYFYDGDKKEEIKYEGFEKVKGIEEEKYIFTDKNIFIHDEKNVFYPGSATDILKINNQYFIAKDNKIILYDKNSGLEKTKYTTAEKILKIYNSSDKIIVFTNNGYTILDINFNVKEYVNLETMPYNIIANGNILIYSIQNKLIIKNLNNIYQDYTREFSYPIVDMEYSDNILYISLYTEGIFSYIINEDMSIEEEKEFLTFNAYDIIT